MIFRERNVTIRKARPCIWCGEAMETGAPAVDVFWKVDGMDATTGALHPECKDASDKYDWDGDDHLFDEGEYRRGEPCHKSNDL